MSAATAVRGFLEREIVRDTGCFANLELYSPNLAGKLVPGEGNCCLPVYLTGSLSR